MSKWAQINLCLQAMRYEMLTFAWAYENIGNVDISVNILLALINGLKVLLAGIWFQTAVKLFQVDFF